MKFPRLSHDPGMLIEFFEEGLTVLGAVCERSWHDRLDLVAEGRAASLWNTSGGRFPTQGMAPLLTCVGRG